MWNGRITIEPGGWTVRVPTRPTGITGTSQPRREPGDTGLALVEPDVRCPGALGVDGEHAAALQDRGGRVERPLRGVAAAAVHGDLPGGPEEPGRLPAVEVLGLGHIGDPAPDHEREEERVAERLVVGGQDHRPVGGDVLAPLDPDAPQQVEERADDRLHDPVGHEATVSLRVLYCTDDARHGCTPCPGTARHPFRPGTLADPGPHHRTARRGPPGRPVGGPVPGAGRRRPAHRRPDGPRGDRPAARARR